MKNNCTHSLTYKFQNAERCYYCGSKVSAKCPSCNGLGEVMFHHPFSEYEEQIKMCPDCDGTGVKS